MPVKHIDNLSDLPHEILIEIAKRLKKLEDFVSFRCVSKLLHAAAKDEYFEGLLKHTPYLMLAVREGNDDTRELYSLVEGKSIVASVKVANFKSKKCLESLGWLLVSQLDGSMSMLEPFSGTEIPLPHQESFQDYGSIEDGIGFFHKMVLTSRPSETSDFVLMVIGGGTRYLGFWRLGDKEWNNIEMHKGAYCDVVYHGDGKFYAIGYPGYVWVFDFSRSDNQMVGRIVVNFMPENVTRVRICINTTVILNELVTYKRLYLFKTIDNSLLIITRTAPNLSQDPDGNYYMTNKFQVYEADTATGKFKEIFSLGSMAVFLGHNNTTAVAASRFSGIKANHIYFTDDYWEYYYFDYPNGGGTDSGVYNMETGTIEPIYPGEVLCSKISPSTWITPCLC